MNRLILHVDMDAFYAAVEMRDEPSLKGKPVIIGSLPGERGVVSTCNYRAREYGIRSAMPIHEAYKRCPHGVFMRPNFPKYEAASKAIREIWMTYTDQVEFLSLDEGFLDVTGSTKLFGEPYEIAGLIKKRTWEEVGLTCSIGFGYCKTAAKLASEENKPNGYFEIKDQQSFMALVANRSVRVVYGVGQKTAERLERLGVKKVSDIWSHQKRIFQAFGENTAESLLNFSKGIDYRPVGEQAKNQSIGTEETFQEDIWDEVYFKALLRLFAKKLCQKLVNKQMLARTVTLKATYPGMASVTRSKTIRATHDVNDVCVAIDELMQKLDPSPVRLIGVTLSNWIAVGSEDKEQGQLSLFDVSEERSKDEHPEAIKKLYQSNLLKTASDLEAEKFLENFEKFSKK